MHIYSLTTGCCPQCGHMVTARLIRQEGAVWQENLCPQHGPHRVCVSSDVTWYEDSLHYVKAGQIPLGRAREQFSGCPHSCGLCPEHRQHTCLPVVEITSLCNLRCPVCLKPREAVFGMTAAQYATALRELVRCEGSVPLLNLSGGEPTLHPEFAEILAISRDLGVMQVSVSTNGLRLFADPTLRALFRQTDTIAALQFDGFLPQTWQSLRGENLGPMKRALITLLEKEGVKYSLTATIARGINEEEVSAIADFFFASQALSLMFQPLAVSGTARSGFSTAHRLTIADVVHQLCQSRHIKEGDFNPLPCSHASCFALAYFFKIDTETFFSLKDFLGKEAFVALIANKGLPGLDYEGHKTLKDSIYAFWSAADSTDSNELVLARIKSIIRELEGQQFSPKAAFDIGSASLKSVFIHNFMDTANFDQGRVMKCCNHYLQADGSLVPMCAHNLKADWQKQQTRGER